MNNTTGCSRGPQNRAVITKFEKNLQRWLTVVSSVVEDVDAAKCMRPPFPFLSEAVCFAAGGKVKRSES